MASNNGDSGDRDATRGSGAEKETQAQPKGFDAPPGAFDNEAPNSAMPDPARGGCMKFGWGCLPVLVGLTLIPISFLP